MVDIFPKGICPKVNVIAWLEYELAYYDSAVHRFNHYTTRTSPLWFGVLFCFVLFCFHMNCVHFIYYFYFYLYGFLWSTVSPYNLSFCQGFIWLINELIGKCLISTFIVFLIEILKILKTTFIVNHVKSRLTSDFIHLFIYFWFLSLNTSFISFCFFFFPSFLSFVLFACFFFFFLFLGYICFCFSFASLFVLFYHYKLLFSSSLFIFFLSFSSFSLLL